MSDGRTKPSFLITIDTEGDNLWAAPETVTTENSRFLPRFQYLCENYGLKPTWLTDFEMADSPSFCDFGRDVLKRKTGEIGMHLHAWNSPPLTGGSMKSQAYLIEYPPEAMAAKVDFMTRLLEQRFECKMASHRAGRWAFNNRYARLLVEQGYVVDCSVTPHVNWAHVRGNRLGGADYTTYPAHPYFMNLDRIDCEGDSPLLEIPVSIVAKPNRLGRLLNSAPRPIRRALRRFSAETTSWLRPNGRNRESMLAILNQAYDERWPCMEFMLHSSELMPGGNPTFKTPVDIESLYADLKVLFSNAAKQYRGQTLREFHDEYSGLIRGQKSFPSRSSKSNAVSIASN